FSVNLTDNVFCCFDAGGGQKGDVIDLWAALHHLDLRSAALDLVRTFDLEPAPPRRTEKRDGEQGTIDSHRVTTKALLQGRQRDYAPMTDRQREKIRHHG